MEQRITSRRNPLLTHTKKLLTSRAYREKCGEFAAGFFIRGLQALINAVHADEQGQTASRRGQKLEPRFGGACLIANAVQDSVNGCVLVRS